MLLLVQMKQTMYAGLLAGNLLLALWALVLYATGRPTGLFYFRILLLLQIIVGLSIAIGLVLVVGGFRVHAVHLLYAVLNGLLAYARVRWHRPLSHGRAGLLLQVVFAFMAVGLIVRSAMTAHG